MRRSLFTTLRALIMLVSLVVVPLWAVMGTEWPAKIVAFFAGQARSDRDVAAEPTSSRDGLAGAPVMVTAPRGTPAAALGMQPQIPAAQLTEPRDMALMPPQAVRQPPPTGVIPASDDRPARDPRAPTANVPAAYEAPAAAPAANPNRRAVVLGPSTDPRDQFKVLERRLRELGATYYRLETWGDNGEFYRFHCQMAVAGHPESSQLFEATDRDAFQAMTRVVHDVEGWRRQTMNAASP